MENKYFSAVFFLLAFGGFASSSGPTFNRGKQTKPLSTMHAEKTHYHPNWLKGYWNGKQQDAHSFSLPSTAPKYNLITLTPQGLELTALEISGVSDTAEYKLIASSSFVAKSPKDVKSLRGVTLKWKLSCDRRPQTLATINEKYPNAYFYIVMDGNAEVQFQCSKKFGGRVNLSLIPKEQNKMPWTPMKRWFAFLHLRTADFDGYRISFSSSTIKSPLKLIKLAERVWNREESARPNVQVIMKEVTNYVEDFEEGKKSCLTFVAADNLLQTFGAQSNAEDWINKAFDALEDFRSEYHFRCQEYNVQIRF